ncbi:MAG: N-6 DNA Methylase [Planctomycetes bacterium ADurb.Bin401]|nr:MAG: N-6 DNA Methylase [Planctomycetes bacterium ADurb.Bin401]
MQPLEKSLRNKLESTIKEARDIAELAAAAALEQLGVGAAVQFKHLNDTEKELRRKLRIHGRQLGDVLKADQTQTLSLLIEEVAYEHWHRMLFAKFLAENNLLMYPDPADPVPVSLGECEDLAVDEGARNGWELASRFAAKMLPQIFRPDSPVFQLILPPEHQLKLEKLLNDLPGEVFKASDSLGWVYQFWQAKKKEDVNNSGVKIGAQELPAVTQLFTEPYMVAFLLDNSLGAWWVAKVAGLRDGNELRPGAGNILKTAETEEELRKFFALSGVPLEYLRFIKTESGSWMPAAGIFEKWPANLSELKTLDPSCGSGHFLVAALLMLVTMRVELEKITAREAMNLVLKDNIHGLELDRRCVELAAFALAFTAWKYPGAGGYRILPELNIACSGLAISAKNEDWLALAGENTNLHLALNELYNQFKDASILGSLINPEACLGKGTLFELEWEDVGPLLIRVLSEEKDDEKAEMGVVALGIAKSVNILSRNFDLVFTNVPYLGYKKMDSTLKQFCEANYANTKADLAMVVFERCIRFCKPGGAVSAVLPQTFSFLGTFINFRKELLEKYSISSFVKLGTKAFQTQLYDFNVSLFQLVRIKPCSGHSFFVIDISKDNAPERDLFLQNQSAQLVNQERQLNNPDGRIITDEISSAKLLEKYAISKRGIVNGDYDKWLRRSWEIDCFEGRWKFIQLAVNLNIYHSGRNTIIDWATGGDEMLRPGLANPAYGKNGIAISRMAKLPCTIYTGEFYDQNTAVLVPNKTDYYIPLWCFATDNTFNEEVRKLDQKVGVTPATFLKVPFDLDHWTKVAAEKYPNGLPKPYSDDPTQWIFHGHPCGSVIWDEDKKWTAYGPLRVEANVLQVAVIRLLGYRWPAELDDKMELSEESRFWVKKSEELLSHADDDGIVCIPPVRGEAAAADRLLDLLAAAYGKEWDGNKLSALLSASDHAGKSLETWLRDKFFLQHCKLFQHRPFIWHVWDGLRDGFSALVNYHKLDKKLMESLIYTYLGDWIRTQKDAIAHGIDGAEEKLAAAENLKKRLELILEGEQPYDIFVRWKPLDKQPIGWDPDINDGVRLNIRPFMTAQVLRFNKKPQMNISWDKDRGKDVESAPWYKLGPHYGGNEGDRINDHHLKLEEKKKVRKEAL